MHARIRLGVLGPADRDADDCGGWLRGTKHFSSYRRLFSAASWSLDAMGLAVFTMIEPFLGDLVMLGRDDTLARKLGLRMFGTGMHHDPLQLGALRSYAGVTDGWCSA